MKVCLICVEIFAWGKYGGFGQSTRMIGRELVKRGIEVTAVVPRRDGQAPVENLDGITVLSFDPNNFLSAAGLFRKANADIYHSQEPSFGTALAMHAMPDRKHIVTLRDTRTARDWLTELSLPSLSAAQVISNWLYEDNWLVHRAVRRADSRFAAALLLIPRARNKYHLGSDPVFLPTPVSIPAKVEKATEPTVCFVSRWDRRKRPELFFELCKEFPKVHFLAAGKSRDKEWDRYLRAKFGHLPNLDMLDFIDQFQSDQLSTLIGKSWIMVNTAAREGLPHVFVEAAAHRCAILSAVDPDGFASQFGYHASQENFSNGLDALLQNDRWIQCAQRGYDYVSETFACETAIDQHLAVYESICNTSREHAPERA